jgi:hypothetical protein
VLEQREIARHVAPPLLVPLARVRPPLVGPLLIEFHRARVPAYAALAVPGSHRARPGPARPDFQNWVGTSAYGRAEETLRVALPRLLRSA